MLEVGSAIDAEMLAERGVRTTTRGRDLPGDFSQRRGGGLLFIAHHPNGQTN